MCASVCRRMSRCNRRLTWLNGELVSSKPKRKCTEGRSRDELPRKGVEIPPELISWCEIRQARAQLDLQQVRGWYRASFFSGVCNERQQTMFAGHKARILHSGDG